MRVVAVIQARMSSERLPGKVLRSIAGRSALAWCVEAASSVSLVDEVVVATSSDPSDDAIVRECQRLGTLVYRGNLQDVLQRMVDVALEYRADAIVRLTADCPLLDPSLVAQCVAVMRADPSLDLVSNCIVRRFPRGLDVEVISREALLRCEQEATGYHREHVTTWLLEADPRKRAVALSSLADNSDLRLTVDTWEDLAVVERVAGALGLGPHSVDVLVSWLRSHPEVGKINSHVRQKGVVNG